MDSRMKQKRKRTSQKDTKDEEQGRLKCWNQNGMKLQSQSLINQFELNRNIYGSMFPVSSFSKITRFK
jgi:hypothetical protein